MMSSWFNVAMLAYESQQVIWLRTVKLASGGPEAGLEAHRMVSEKVAAASQAAVNLMSGHSADSVVNGYRKKVRANVRRLTR